MKVFLDEFRRPSLNWLLIAFPLAIIAEIAHLRSHAAWASPTLIFFLSAIAIIPLAGWMGRSTEHIAHRLGEGIGGLLNATFGNAAELIIAFMALLEAARHPEQQALMHGIVKASLTGSIIGNVLLVLGVALLAGGLKYNVQRFNPTAARASATLMYLAAAALLIPGLFTHVTTPLAATVQNISLELSILLLIVYGISLVFTLKTHRHLYVGNASPAPGHEGDAGHETPAGEPGEEAEADWPIKQALTILVLSTIGVGVLAELMVGSVHAAAAALGWTDLFVGVIVVAIVGNAAEHSTAVLVAMRNRMDLSLTIAIGSSIQIALFVAPVLILISHVIGPPMSLVFTIPEIVAVGVAVITASQIAEDGESHWLEGVLLLTLYVMLGVLFFHLPGEAGLVPS